MERKTLINRTGFTINKNVIRTQNTSLLLLLLLLLLLDYLHKNTLKLIRSITITNRQFLLYVIANNYPQYLKYRCQFRKRLSSKMLNCRIKNEIDSFKGKNVQNKYLGLKNK